MCAHVTLQQVDIARASPAILLAQEKRISELRADQSQSRLIYELEKERVMYRLSSYLKARICKIKRLALYLASPEGADARSHMTDKVRARHVLLRCQAVRRCCEWPPSSSPTTPPPTP